MSFTIVLGKTKNTSTVLLIMYIFVVDLVLLHILLCFLDFTTPATVTNGTASSTLPPPPPGFTAKTTPTATPSIPGSAIRAPGTALNNTVNHSLWTGGGANVKGEWTFTKACYWTEIMSTSFYDSVHT